MFLNFLKLMSSFIREIFCALIISLALGKAQGTFRRVREHNPCGGIALLWCKFRRCSGSISPEPGDCVEGGRDREKSEKIPGFWSWKKVSGGAVHKVEKNKRRSRSREEGRSRKAAECDVPARALESVSHWPLREEPYQAGGIIEVMNEAAQDVCTGWKEEWHQPWETLTFKDGLRGAWRRNREGGARNEYEKNPSSIWCQGLHGNSTLRERRIENKVCPELRSILGLTTEETKLTFKGTASGVGKWKGNRGDSECRLLSGEWRGSGVFHFKTLEEGF